MRLLNKPLSASYLLYALVALWLLMQLWLFDKFGVQIVHDSLRYIEDANHLRTVGDFRLSYVSYTLLLAAFLKLTGTAVGVVWLQLACALMALLAFFKLAHHLFGNIWMAFLAGALLLIWPDYQQWNLYIHTESLYVSTIIFVFLRTMTAQKVWHYFQLALLLVFLLFLRSNGFMVALAAISYLVSDSWLKKGYKLRWLFIILLVGGIPLLILLAHFFLTDMSGLHSFSGHLVAETVLQGYSGVRVEGGSNIVLTGGSPLQQIMQVMQQEPLFFIKRSFLRFLYYWGQVRPYFAASHNWAICLFFFPQYLLALYGVLNGQIRTPLLIAIIVFAALNTMMVLVSGVDWDNRFMMPMLPFIYLSAIAGLHQLGRGNAYLKLAKHS